MVTNDLNNKVYFVLHSLIFFSGKRYDPENEKDAAILLDLLENASDLELSDDDGMEDNEFDRFTQTVRLGADKIGPNTVELSEIHGGETSREETQSISNSDSDWEEEDDLPLSVFVASSSKNITGTRKPSVKWTKRDFEIPDISWQRDAECEIDPADDVLSPLHYFQRYFGDLEFENIAECTNIYAHQQNIIFKQTNSAEIKSLFGLHIAVGSLKFPRVRLFWDKALRINLFHETMTRDRFFQLRSNLHCVNNLEKPEDCTDKLYKVRPIYNAIRKRCLELQLEENLCIDEQIVPFRGHLSIKQFVKGKPTPWGVKIFVLCGKSGVAYDFLIYQGSSTEFNEETLKKYGLGAATVLHLSQRISNEGHKLYFDNYFSSYQLLQTLKSKKIFAAGTVRVNRFYKPPLLEDKSLKHTGRGSYDEVTNEDGDVVLVKWMDNRSVILASNFVGVGSLDEVSRWDKSEKKYVTVSRPEIVKLYNHSMGGVDLMDQMIGLYRIYIRSRKWPLRLIFHAVDFAIVNSWFEYRQDCNRLKIPKKAQMDLLDFRLRLAECLVKVGNPVQIKRGRPSSSTPELSRKKIAKCNEEVRPIPEVQHDSIDHLPQLDGCKEGKRCKNGKCNKKTHFYCDKCLVHLCIKKERNCFVIYHRK